MTQYTVWLVTPSYNLLALAFSLIALGGLLAGLYPPALERSPTALWPPNGGFTILGAAGVALTDVKGTAGMGVGALCLIAMVVMLGPRSALSAGASVGVGMAFGLILSGIVVGSPITSARTISRYSEMTAIGDIYPVTAVWELRFLAEVVIPWVALVALASLAIKLAWRLIRRVEGREIAMAVCSIGTAILLWGDRAQGGKAAFADRAGWWWLQSAGWTLLFLTSLAPRRTRVLALGPLIALGGLGTAIGSNNGLIRQCALTAAVFALGVASQAVIVASSTGWRPLTLLPAAVFMLTAGYASLRQVPEALADPYRLGVPVAANSTPVHLGDFGTVEVTPQLAVYVRGMQAIAPLVPSEARDCLVDLSGGTPLSAIALNSRSATNAWVMGGYPRSDAALAYLLTFATCIEGRVLLIEAPDGERSIERPPILENRPSRVLGSVRLDAYLTEVQVVSVLEPVRGSPRSP